MQFKRKLIEDNPTKNDAFSGGGHRRVADSLSRTISELDSRDAVIGLEGGWGAGKSSVIEMAQDKLVSLKDGKEYYVMTFDLWANQSLYFRRSFLEQFVAWALQEKELSNTNKKRDDLENIAKTIGGKEQIVETRTEARFNLLGALLVLILPLLPVLYVWLSPLAMKPIPVPNCDPDCPQLSLFQNWLMNNGTTISALILGGFFLFAIVRYAAILFDSGRPIESLKELAVLVERKTEDHIEKKLIRDVDPSNTEFTTTFRDILRKLQTSKKRIVIVFDNVDRLNENSASTTWSDLQAVLLRQTNAPIDQVLTAVVPYDRQVMERAIFGLKDETSDESEFDTQDLFRKSFDAIHHIAPPVISDVDEFVKTQLNAALDKQVTDSVKDRVARVFDLFGREHGKTPRQVTSFVNDITTIWVEWQNEIPLDAIAVFVANRRDIEADRSATAITKISKGVFSYRVECSVAELEEYLAMLTFSAPKELAVQVALRQPIQEQLTRKDSQDFVDLLSESAAFPVVLGRVLDDNAGEIAKDVDGFENAISNLERVGPAKDHIQAGLRNLIQRLPSLSPTGDPEDVDAYPAILKTPAFAPEEDLDETVSNLTKWLQRALSDDTTKREKSHGTYWVRALAQIRDAVIESTDDVERWRALQAKIALPTGPDFIHGAVAHMSSHNFQLKEFRTGGLYFTHRESLFERISDLSDDTLKEIEQFTTLIPAVSLKPFVEKVVKAINASQTNDLDDIAKLETLLSLYPTLAARLNRNSTIEQSKSLIENGAVFACLGKIAEAREIWQARRLVELCVLLMAAIRFSLPNKDAAGYQNHPSLGNISASITWFNDKILIAEQDEETVQTIADSIRTLKLDYQFLYFSAFPEKAGSKPNLYPQIGSKLLDEKPILFLTDADFLKCFDMLYKLNPNGTISYGNFKDKQDESWNEIEPLGIEINVLSVISDTETQAWPSLLKKVDDALGARSQENWRTDLAKNTHALWVLQNRLLHGDLKFPTAQLKKPFLDHLVAVATTNQEPVDEIETLLKHMPNASLKSFRQSFLDSLGTKPADGLQLLRLHNAAENFLASLDLASKPDVALQKILLPLLDAPNAEVGQFIEENASTFAAITRDLGQEASAQVVDILTTMSEPEGFDKMAVANQLGVSLPKAKRADKDKKTTK